MVHGAFCAPILILSILSLCAAQMPSPLQGYGIEPSEPTKVYVSCCLDKLLKVDENQYGFEAVIYIHMSWVDKRAVATVFQRTAEVAAGGPPCTVFCDGLNSRCCDTVWRPTFTITNMEAYPQDRVDYMTLAALGPRPDPNDGRLFANDTLAIMKWVVRFNGRFYSSMNFWRFPFDRQALFITAWQRSASGAVAVEASTTCSELRGTSTGPFDVPGTDLPAWKGELSEAMKEKMRKEYLGLGESPNSPLKGNRFLTIIIGITVLVVLFQLFGQG